MPKIYLNIARFVVSTLTVAASREASSLHSPPVGLFAPGRKDKRTSELWRWRQRLETMKNARCSL